MVYTNWCFLIKYALTYPCLVFASMNTSANEKPAKPSLQWVTGTIKMYREKDGYGFITDGSTEYYFNVHSLEGEIVPRPGMKCEFIPVPARKPGLKPMVITSTEDAEPPRDSRLKLPCLKTEDSP